MEPTTWLQPGRRARTYDHARTLCCGAFLLLIVLTAADPATAQDSTVAAAKGATRDTPVAAVNVTAARQGGQRQTFGPPYNPLKPDGGTVWGVFSGYGFNQSINNSAEGINAATFGVRWSHMWDARLGSFLRGHPAFGIEVVPLTSFVQADKTTWAGGFNLLYEHHFAVAGRVLPIWKLGAGFLYSDKDLPEGETRHNFTLLTELGVDIMVTDSSALFIGYRFHHVSNANTGNVNPGINLHTMMFGLSLYR